MSESIAIIGTGISGLAAAWLLQRKYDIEVFEKEDYVGGHTHTVDADLGDRTLPVDTGFIVYNEITYPNLVQLFKTLGVATQPSDMSFSVHCDACDIEYSGTGLPGLFAQKKNLCRLSFLRMLRDITRFNKLARTLLEEGIPEEMPLKDFILKHGFSEEFARHYLIPMASAIWSSGPGQTDLFPARALLEFMNNHGLLGVFGHLQWRTVSGGSIQYVKAITREFSDRIHVACPVRKIERKEGGVVLHFDDIEAKHYDHVVIAAHADQALAMLENPSSAETELLQPWNYSQNATVLHTDTACMPAHRAAWASWNYHLQNCRQIDAAVNLDYWMNQLQTIESPPDIIVSLNPVHPPAPEKILNSFLYEHPVYTRESMATQSRLPSLNGLNNTYFCGAYHRWGFHEDGLVSAIRVAEQLGVSFP